MHAVLGGFTQDDVFGTTGLYDSIIFFLSYFCLWQKKRDGGRETQNL
jgi:hypothetical protein